MQQNRLQRSQSLLRPLSRQIFVHSLFGGVHAQRYAADALQIQTPGTILMRYALIEIAKVKNENRE